MRRRVVLWAAAVIGLSALGSAPAAAHAPSPSTGAAAGTGAGTPVCTPNPKEAAAISGLVATNSGYYAVPDSQTPGGKPKIYVLDSACKLTGTINYPSLARDPEDAAMDRNGTLYIADIGDNDEAAGGSKDPRATVAVWTMAADAKQPTINRLTYPDGKKHDAEAMLIGGDGLPIIITKAPPSEIWVPEGPLVPNTEKGVKLKKVGTFTAQETKTPNPFSILGWKLVTGAASAPDGSKVVVRTYSDAYEFDVPGGDVVKAITTGKPRITPLPNEPQGESITYTPDGKYFITASDQDSTKRASLLRYTPSTVTAGGGAGAGDKAPSPKANDQSFLQSLTLQDITYAVAAIGVIGLGLVIAGVIGIRRSRAARRAAGPGTGALRAPIDAEGDELMGAPLGGAPGGMGGNQPPGGGTVYGIRPGQPPAQPGGSVYGAGPGSPQSAPPGNVYGGGAQPGNVYGGGRDRSDNVYGAGGRDRSDDPYGAGGGRDRSDNVYGGGNARGGAPQAGNAYGDRRYERDYDERGGYGPQSPGGFAQMAPPDRYDRRGGYGPGRGDHDGYERGYAPHR